MMLRAEGQFLKSGGDALIYLAGGLRLGRYPRGQE